MAIIARPLPSPPARRLLRLALVGALAVAGHAAASGLGPPAPAVAAMDKIAAATAAASAAQARVAVLEQQLQQQRSAGGRERPFDRGGPPDLASRSAMVPWLGACLLAMSLLAAWLAWRLCGQSAQGGGRGRSRACGDSGVERPPGAPAGAAGELPALASSLAPPAAHCAPDHAAQTPRTQWADAAGPGPCMTASAMHCEPTLATLAEHAAAPPSPGAAGGARVASAELSLGTGVPPRRVTVEELIDLEQQAEFFVMLGQDDAAIDLLLGHIRGSGGASPLPYLKLLEIYRRQGDAIRYERVRARFNLRFNGVAPAWNGDLQTGFSLEDYPAIVAQLQSLWVVPQAAMDRLESLLLRRSDFTPFDLPAFREILLLYALARELREGSDLATQGAHPPAAMTNQDAGAATCRNTLADDGCARSSGTGHYRDLPALAGPLDVDLDRLVADVMASTRPLACADFGFDGDRLALEAALAGRLVLPPTQQRH